MSTTPNTNDGREDAISIAKAALARARQKFQDGFENVPFCELASAMDSLLSSLTAAGLGAKGVGDAAQSPTPESGASSGGFPHWYWELRDTKQALWVTEAKLAEANRLLEADANIRAEIVRERDVAKKERDEIMQARGEYVEELRGQLAMFEKREGELMAQFAAQTAALEEAKATIAQLVEFDAKKVEQYRTELEALRRDKERLDWLEQEAYEFRPDEEGFLVIRAYDGEPFKEPDIRAAIDAARTPPQPEGGKDL